MQGYTEGTGPYTTVGLNDKARQNGDVSFDFTAS